MSKYKDFYKFNDKKDTTQAARRARILEEQKNKRQLQYSSGRNEEKQCKAQKSYKVNLNYKDCLMLSEWMMEAPEDIEDFILVPCPKGIRCTLVVDFDKTSLYFKSGKFIKNIRTNLPNNTVLDCFFVKASSAIYILDVLQYKSRDFVDCDFAFRSYWIKSKFTEEEFHIDSADNTKLKVIDTYDFADSLQIDQCHNTHPIFSDGTELDGYLYYHKEGSYTFGESPLVLWLFPFMVEELMPMYKIHPCYNELKPENYSTYLQYISDFEEKRKRKSGRKSSAMDFETSTDTVNDEEDVIQQSIDLEMHGEF